MPALRANPVGLGLPRGRLNCVSSFSSVPQPDRQPRASKFSRRAQPGGGGGSPAPQPPNRSAAECHGLRRRSTRSCFDQAGKPEARCCTSPIHRREEMGKKPRGAALSAARRLRGRATRPLIGAARPALWLRQRRRLSPSIRKSSRTFERNSCGTLQRLSPADTF